MNSFDVDIWISADLELEASVSLFTITTHLVTHYHWVFLRDGAVKNEVIAMAATEQCADGNTAGLS